jgi:hypothetical protein
MALYRTRKCKNQALASILNRSKAVLGPKSGIGEEFRKTVVFLNYGCGGRFWAIWNHAG